MNPTSGTIRLYKALKNLRTTTRPELSKATSLSLPMVGTIVDTLVEYDLAALNETNARGRRGRPIHAVTVCPEKHRVAAIDFSGPRVLTGLFDLYGNCLKQEENEACFSLAGMTPEKLEVFIADHLSKYDQVEGCGISIPGIIQEGTIHESWLLHAGTTLNVKAALEQRLGVPVRVEKDSNSSAWGEFRHRKLKSNQTLLFLIFAHGIGAGLVVSGRLHRGANGAAGEVALLRGSAEGYLKYQSSSSGTQTKYHIPGFVTVQTSLDKRIPLLGDLAFEILFKSGIDMSNPICDLTQKVINGDRAAQNALGQFNRYIAMMLASTIVTLDPDLVVLQNIWPHTDELFMKPIEQYLHGHVIANLSLSQVGNQAGLFGIAIATAEDLERQLLEKVQTRNKIE